MRTILGLAAAMSLTAGYAFAQTTTPPAPAQPSAAEPSKTTPSAATDQKSMQGAETVTWYQKADDDVAASKIIGTNVRNSAGEKIGDVNELILGTDGKVRAAIIGVGGFLGMGEHDVAVAFNSLKFTRGSGNDEVITMDTTKEVLKTAPQWERRRTGG